MKGVIKGKLQVAATIVTIDQNRMDKALAEERINVPIGLTKEQKRQFILEASKKHGNDTSK